MCVNWKKKQEGGFFFYQKRGTHTYILIMKDLDIEGKRSDGLAFSSTKINWEFWWHHITSPSTSWITSLSLKNMGSVEVHVGYIPERSKKLLKDKEGSIKTRWERGVSSYRKNNMYACKMCQFWVTLPVHGYAPQRVESWWDFAGLDFPTQPVARY